MLNSFVIRLASRFDFSSHKKFSEECTQAIDYSDATEIILDFTQVDYLDSSALGMMVLMQKKSVAKNKIVKLKGARDATDDILKMANMQKIIEFI